MPALSKAKLNNSDPAVLGEDADAGANSPALTNSSAAADALPPETVTLAGSGIVFQNTYSATVSPQFRTAIIAAENFFQSHFSNTVTVSMSFDLGTPGSQFSGRNQFNPVPNVSYATLVNALTAHATTADDIAAVRSLPAVDPTGGTGFSVPVGMARVLGIPGGGSATDDTVILNKDLPWTFGTDAIGTLEHEISEGVFGRVGGLGAHTTSGAITPWGPMDLFRYSAAGQRDYAGGSDGRPSYFSINGTSLLAQFHNSLNTAGANDGQDFADWDGPPTGDAFGPGGPASPGTVSVNDLRVLDILGWTPTSDTLSSSANFTVADMMTGTTTAVAGAPYDGPVAGLLREFIDITPDNLNITSYISDAFIHSGSGADAIDLSHGNGNNILDGSTGSNFLTGGKGNDTFFLDDRNATSDTWSSVLNFHSGDNATIWGITQSGFALTWLDNQGASGAKGLTAGLVSVVPGSPTVNITLAGFTTADLNTRLTVTYGRSADVPGLAGSVFMNIHAI